MTSESGTVAVVRRQGIVALLGIAVIVGGLITCGALIKVSGAVVASGTVSVIGDVKSVAHPDGGVVVSIDAEDGDQVKAGDLLFELDGQSIRSEIDALQTQVEMSEMTLARLQALRENASSVLIPESMRARAGEPDIAGLVELQNSLLSSTRASASAATAQIESQLDQLRIQARGAEQSRDVAKSQSATIDQQIAEKAGTPLTLATAAQISELTDEKSSIGAQILAFDTQISGLKAAMVERSRQVDQIQSASDVEVLAGYESEGKNLASLNASLNEATARLATMRVVAPVEGIVALSSLHTIGGVVPPGETVMTVVPTDSGLAVKANLGTADVDKARQGGAVRVLLAGLDPATPQLDGFIAAISPVASEDAQSGVKSYSIDVSLPPSQVERLGPDATLVSGMPVEIFITTQERSVLSYLAEPLLSRLLYSLRED